MRKSLLNSTMTPAVWTIFLSLIATSGQANWTGYSDVMTTETVDGEEVTVNYISGSINSAFNKNWLEGVEVEFRLDGQTGFDNTVTTSNVGDQFENAGVVRDSSNDERFELDLSQGDDLFINSGAIYGQINLGDGADADTFVLSASPDMLGDNAIVSGGTNGTDTLELLAGEDSEFYFDDTDLDKLIEFEVLRVSEGDWTFNADLTFNNMDV